MQNDKLVNRYPIDQKLSNKLKFARSLNCRHTKGKIFPYLQRSTLYVNDIISLRTLHANATDIAEHFVSTINSSCFNENSMHIHDQHKIYYNHKGIHINAFYKYNIKNTTTTNFLPLLSISLKNFMKIMCNKIKWHNNFEAGW